jgi:AcrR family transcriptional regulator
MDIAIDCFARYGYQGRRFDRIAKAAGLTKGAIYYHFKDKEELLFAAVEEPRRAVRAPGHQRHRRP